MAGGKNESTLQPLWLPSNELVFVTDSNGFWNLYMQTSAGEVKPILPAEEEYLGGPDWWFGIQDYGVLADGRSEKPYMLNPIP